MLIRPQMAQAKKVKAMLAALKVGDEVSTSAVSYTHLTLPTTPYV